VIGRVGRRGAFEVLVNDQMVSSAIKSSSSSLGSSYYTLVVGFDNATGLTPLSQKL